MIIRLHGPVRASAGTISAHHNGLVCDNSDEFVWYYSLEDWLYLGISNETGAIAALDSYGGFPGIASAQYCGSLGADFYKAFLVGDYDEEPSSYLDVVESFLHGEDFVDPAACLWWVGDVSEPGMRIFENGWIHCTPAMKVAGLTIHHEAFGAPALLAEDDGRVPISTWMKRMWRRLRTGRRQLDGGIG